jgi:ABC-2 type transport system ATP-binding protein
VRLDRVSKRYGLGQPWTVRGVSAEVAAGQLIRLEGPNGSGKSTLLRVAAGVCTPSAGRVTGRPHTGYVPERFPGGLAFSARDYLMHMGRIHGLRGRPLAVSVEEWLGRLGAADYAGSPLRTLSKGMCQKVAIAQALLPRPGLLVLDEAWTGLDQAARGALDTAVAERLTDGGTVMFVDHHQARLAGQVSQRWQLGSGAVRVVAGPAASVPGQAGAMAAAGTVAGGTVAGQAGLGNAAPSVLIELSGVDPESLPQLALVPGVLTAQRVPVPEGTEPGPLRVRLTCTAAESDRVLRQLLGWDDVHVLAVGPAEGAPA